MVGDAGRQDSSTVCTTAEQAATSLFPGDYEILKALCLTTENIVRHCSVEYDTNFDPFEVDRDGELVRTLTDHRSNCISLDFHSFGDFCFWIFGQKSKNMGH
ncbi:hypothetical protein L1887_31639 [Cichorium endivia]|nr:hypothetical protein L1887_31639 [Cichorium endivia]